MKTRTALCSLTAIVVAALGQGCVGYNTTLFMTKSNAGLDFDAQPPTAEANISRKEAVIAPAFEGGQTPPVMASFGAKMGTGGAFQRFFFGVDQTFSGGDAAVTMGKLYAAPTDTTSPASKFDSTLPLTTKPKANLYTSKLKRRLFALPEPGEVRPFVFGTDTQLGAKIAWTGVGSPIPKTLKFGFNRKEVAVAPVTLKQATNTSTKAVEYHVKMPSFLATVESNVATEGTDADLAFLQYFATGESANALARQNAVRSAMLKRSDPGADFDAAAALAARDFDEQSKTQAEKVLAYVVDASGNVDKAKLTTVFKGISGLEGNEETYLDKAKLENLVKSPSGKTVVAQMVKNIPAS